MRVLHVNKFLYRRGGAEAYMLDVAELQRAAGHEVEIFGMHHPENPADLVLADTFAPHIELEPVPPGASARIAAASRMIWSPSSRRGLAEAIRRFRPDVVHCHNIYHQLSPSVLKSAAAAEVPVVMTLHDYKLACPSYQMLDHGMPCDACVGGGPWQAARHRCKDGSLGASALLSLESSLHRRLGAYAAVGAFICPSRFLADVMRRADIYPDRLRVVPHFVTVDPQTVPSRPGTRFTFGGRLSHEKGVDVLVRAVGLAGPDVRLDVAGDGPSRSSLEALAAQVAPGKVTFHGRLSRDELRALMRDSLATVVPSRWYENQPMTILESLSAGIPVIATDMGGIPELVRTDVEGWLVPPNDPGAVAACLDDAVARPDKALAMGRAACARMAEDFSAERHLERLDQVYAEVARRTASAVSGAGVRG